MADGLRLPGYEPAQAPRSVVDYPSMTTDGEKALLYWLAKELFTGDGIIVDAGIFLGASSNAFALGVKDNPSALTRLPPSRKPINSYDMAIWQRGMRQYVGHPALQKVLNGDGIDIDQTFLPALKALLAEHLDLIELRIGDIVREARADAPVEIAFYDCLKTDERDLAALRAFAPWFVPGHTIVIQQDYFYQGAIHNKLRQEYFSEHFSYLGEQDTSAVFRYDTPIPEEVIAADPVASTDLEAKLALLDQAADRAESAKPKAKAKLAAVNLLLESRKIAQAGERLSELERSNDIPTLTSRVRQRLDKKRTRMKVRKAQRSKQARRA